MCLSLQEVRLIDYEKMVDANGFRIVAFGQWAGRRQDGEDEGNQDSMTSFGQVGPRISSISPPASPPYLTVALTLTPVKWYAPHLQSNYLSGHFTLFLLNQ